MATTGLPLPSNALPTSNVAGNNQTSPGLSNTQGIAQPFNPILPTGSTPSTNPYLSATATTPTGGTSAGSLYNPASSYSSGQTDISKQLIDIYGKGVGGSLNYLLQNMSGTDSAIFQQYLASMKPQMAQAQTALNQGLGAEGVGGNSSVNALAQANLQSQFLAQESGVNSNLMQQQLQDTMSILTGAAPSAQKEVAQSGWTDFANVMANVTGDIGALMGGPGPSSASIPGSTQSPQTFLTPQLGGGNLTDASAGGYNYNPFQSSASSMYSAPDLSSFGSSAPDVVLGG